MDKNIVTKNDIINKCSGNSLFFIDFMITIFIFMIVAIIVIVVHEYNSIIELEKQIGLTIIFPCTISALLIIILFLLVIISKRKKITKLLKELENNKFDITKEKIVRKYPLDYLINEARAEMRRPKVFSSFYLDTDFKKELPIDREKYHKVEIDDYVYVVSLNEDVKAVYPCNLYELDSELQSLLIVR